MPDRFLLDSNILILLFNDRLAEPLPDGDLSCSIITEMEVLSFPKLSDRDTSVIRGNFELITIHPIDFFVKEEAIRLRRRHKLKLPDAIIAATSLVHDAVLVTNDEEILSLPGLKCRPLAAR